jgi:hypothetical protein
MQAAPSIAGYADLFTSLQSVQATVQVQLERFHRLMADIKVVASAHPDEEGVRVVGDAALKLHRAHALLYGGAQAATTTPTAQADAAPVGEELDLQHAINDFSTLLSNSQSTSREVTALLDAAEQELARLHATTN